MGKYNNISIGYDAKRIVRNNTGLGNYGRTLINALAEVSPELQLRLYAPDEGNERLRNEVIKANNISFVYPKNLRFRFQKDLWRQAGIVNQLQQDRVQLYHGLSGELPKGIAASGIKSIVTIHDLIFLRHPEYYTFIDAFLYKRKFLHTCQEADRIVAISQCTKRDILHYSDFPEERINVVYQSCGTRFRDVVSNDFKAEIVRKYQLPKRFLLFVGSIEERKNLLLAVKALLKLPQDISIVAVGRKTKYTQKVEKFAQSHGIIPRLHFLHGISNAELPAIYQQAECFVYPSRYEGFGIPIIEAIQSGLPVVGCTGSCLEEAGGTANLYVDPDNETDFAAAVSALLVGNNDRQRRIEESQNYIKRFENGDVAQAMLTEYDKLLNL